MQSPVFIQRPMLIQENYPSTACPKMASDKSLFSMNCKISFELVAKDRGSPRIVEEITPLFYRSNL